jgi:membrane-bound serine protease (ClpP class)
MDLRFSGRRAPRGSRLAGLGVAAPPLAPGLFEQVVHFLAEPLVGPILLALGFLGLLIEVKHPTLGVAGGLGFVSLVLFFGSRWMVHLAGPIDLLLVGSGVLLIGLELFVVPGFGVPGVLGLIALVAGVFLSLLGHAPTQHDMLQASGLVATAVLLVLVLGWAVIRHIPHSRTLGALGPGGSASREEGFLAAAPREDLVGTVGRAVTDLRPSGTALFGDERVDVVSEGRWIEAGTPVRVVSSEGYRHVVREAEAAPAPKDRP